MYIELCEEIYQKFEITNIYPLFVTATFTKTLMDVHTTFGSDVKLECAVSDPTADCSWYKDGRLLDGLVRIEGNHRILHFASISHDNEGEYECRCGNESTKATLAVQGMHKCMIKILIYCI